MESQASLASALSSSTNTFVTPSEPSASFRTTFAFSPVQSFLLLPIIQHFAPFSSSSSVQSSKIPLENKILSYVHNLYPAILGSHLFSFIAAHKIIQFFLTSILIFHWVTASPSLNIKAPEKEPRGQKFDLGKTAISGGLYPAYLEHAV